jgi:pimeloyl-ACP methyl ester carboxylesterase
MVNATYNFLRDDYTVWSVLRKPAMPLVYTFRDMAGDLAGMIRAEFGRAVDVLGISTGGSLCQQFAADHPDLVRRLVIHSAAYRLSPQARIVQREVGRLAAQGQWRAAWTTMLRYSIRPTWYSGAQVALASFILSRSNPSDPSDLLITIEAEDQFDFRDRLCEISAPTLVIAGADDPFYSPELFRDTARGIPGARLILYPNMGHPAAGKQFERDTLAFLREGSDV